MLSTPTGHCLTLHRRSVYAAAAAVLAATSLGGTATAFAKDGDGGGDARSRVACGAGGELELRAKEDDGGIEVKVKLDRNVAGEDWLVTLTDNGTVRLSETRTTGGSSGSFEIETLLMPDGTTPTGTGTSPTSTGSSTSTTSATSTGSSTSSTSATSTGSSTSSTSATKSSTPSTSATKSSTPSTSATSTSSGSPTTDDHGGRVGLRAPAAAAAPAASSHTIEVTGVHGSLTCSTFVKL